MLQLIITRTNELMVSLSITQIIGIAVAALLSFLFFLYRAYQQNSELEDKVQQLNKELEDSTRRNKALNDNSLTTFLATQKKQSKEQYKNQSTKQNFEFCFDDSMESQVALLRAYYLKVEQIALKWQHDNEKYWLAITKSLRQVFNNLGIENQNVEFAKKDQIIHQLTQELEIAKANQNAPIKSPEIIIQESLNNIEQITDSLESALQCNSKQEESLADNFSEDSFFGMSPPYKENISSLKDSVSSTNTELVDFQEKIKALTQEIDFLKGIKTESLDENSEFNSDVLYNQASKLSQKLNDDNLLSQVTLLRENNAEQRDFIVKLRNDISALENDIASQPDLAPEEVQEKLLEIEKLEQMVFELEHCIIALESEVELLHKKLDEFNRAKQDNDVQADSDSELSDSFNASQEVIQLKQQLKNTEHKFNDQSILVELSMKLAKCEKIVDLLVEINNSITSLELLAAIYIRTEIANNKSIPTKLLNSQEEELLASKVVPERGARFTTNTKEFFWDKNISLIIANLPEDEERKNQIKETIPLMIGIISSEVKRIEIAQSSNRQQKTLQRLLTATDKEITTIDSQQELIKSEYSKVFQSAFTQLEQITQLPNLPDEAKLMIKTTITESKLLAQSLENADSLVSSGFISLLRSLEKRLEHK